MTYTPGNIVQYNEYYPFGLQTAQSWTRDNNTANNFLGNGGTELNTTSNLYDLDYRNYDPVLGRMNGVDPMANMYSSLTPYNFSFNDPVAFTDPNGADPNCATCGCMICGNDDRSGTAKFLTSPSQWSWKGDPAGAGTAWMGPSYDPESGQHSMAERNSDGTWGYWFNRNYTGYNYSVDAEGNLVGEEINVISSSFIGTSQAQMQGGYGALFNSMDAAAIDWGLRYNDNSIQSGKEFGSSIYQVGRKFAYTKPRIGTDEVEPSPSPKKYKTVAVIHSHAKFANGNEYSDADMEYSRDNHFPVYLATPMGALLKYPGTYVNDGIYQFLPSDSRDPLRRNTVDSSIGPKDEPTWGFRDSWDYWWNN